MILALYAGAASLAAPVLRRMLRRRVARGKEIAVRLPERFGIDPTPRPAGRLIWLHAASMGETASVLPVIEALLAEGDVTVLVTTGTVTSAALVAERLGDRVLHRFVPLDVPSWVARFLDHWRPDAAGFVESEIWPNLLAAGRRRGVPMLLINGRMSRRSFRQWQRVPGVARRLLACFARVQAQSSGDAAHFAALGANNVSSPGNLKFAAPPLPADPAALAGLERLLADRPVWLAAQTHPGEDRIVLGVHAALSARHPGLLTVIAPRHAERGAEIAAQVADAAVARRGLGENPPAESGIWIADTMGELGLLYRAIKTVFVGRSLAVFGGQNPLEPARLGCAVAVGPHTQNFTDVVDRLQRQGALSVVADPAALAAWVETLLADPARRRTMGEAGMAAARDAEDLPAEIARTLRALAR